MKNILCLLLLAGAIATQAQTPNELFRHIPADADHVYHVRLDAIGAKTPWASIATLLKDRNLGSHHPITGMDIASFMNSGIDFHQDIVVAESNAFAADSPKYYTFIIHLTDSGKLAAFIRAKAKEGHGEPLHFIHVGKERIAMHDHDAAAWTDHLAVLLTSTPPAGHSDDTTNASAAHVARYQASSARRCAAALHGYSDTYFLTNPTFTAAFADDADVHIWNRHTNGFGGMGKMLMGSKANNLEGLSQLVQKAHTDATIGTLRFLPGKIVYRNQRLITPTEKIALQHFAGQGLSPELAAAVPPGELMGLMTVHFDMTAWADSMGKTPVAGMFTAPLQKKGLTLQDLPKALKGDFMILAYTPDKNASGARPMPSVYLVTTVNDKATFIQVAKAVKFADAAAPDDTTATDTSHHKMQIYYGLQSDLAVLTSSREQAGAFFNHPAATANPTARLLTPQAYTNSFTLGIDMQAVGDFLTPLLTKGDTLSAKNKGLLEAVHQMDILQLSTGAIHDDVVETNVELRMTDANKNALSSFADILSSLSKSPH
jgi:hypothetical protein